MIKPSEEQRAQAEAWALCDEKTRKEIVELAAAKMVGFTQSMQIAQLRLKCAEIVFMGGSQTEKLNLTSIAEKIYLFAIGKQDPAKTTPS